MPTRIHIFRTGRHTPTKGPAIDFSESTVAAIAASYDPALSEAPVVIGHPKTDDPAFGWVKGLSFADDGLHAEVAQMEPTFADAVKAGRYKKISASFYPPRHPNNPTPGQYYLRHVGFLGAATPAVKGLQPVQFNDGGGDGGDGGANDLVTVEFAAGGGGQGLSGTLEFAATHGPVRVVATMFRALREHLIADKGTDMADAVLPNHRIDDLTRYAAEDDGPRYADPTPDTNPEEDSMQDPQKPDPRDVDFAAREKQLQDAEAEFAAKQAHAAAADFIKPLVEAGKVLPAEQDELTAFMASLGKDDTVTFADGKETKPAVDVLKTLLESLPPRVDFSERTPKGDDPDSTVSFAAPAGYSADPDKLALHMKATGIMGRNPDMTYLEAVRQAANS